MVEHIGVPVEGGELFAARSGEGAPVLAIHGLSANHRTWAPLLPLDGIDLVAVDLRGRGASGGLPGPFGMAAHAEDMVRVLDHLGIERAVVAGHSMGAYVAAVLAVEHPDRVAGLMLVDGGLTAKLADDADPDAVLAAVVGPALDRLDMSFATMEDYFDFWRRHPAFAGAWSAAVEDYLRWDIGTEAPYRSRAAKDAVLYDGRDLLTSDDVRLAVTRAPGPVTLLRAPRGLLDQPQPLIGDELLEEFRPAIAGLVDRMVPDCNHYTILLGAGARHVARTLEAAAAQVGR